jgi:hypothetical protein
MPGRRPPRSEPATRAGGTATASSSFSGAELSGGTVHFDGAKFTGGEVHFCWRRRDG